MDVRTPSAMKPKKAMDIRVGCHEKRVPLKMATGMLTAQPMTRMWMLVTNQRMLLVPAGKHMKALKSRWPVPSFTTVGLFDTQQKFERTRMLGGR